MLTHEKKWYRFIKTQEIHDYVNRMFKDEFQEKLDNGTLETETFVFAMYNSGVHNKKSIRSYDI